MPAASLQIAVCVLGLSLSGCALPYYVQAAGGQVKLLRQRVPIEDVVASAEADDDTRQRLELVKALRRFAVNELDLPDNDSYTSYVELDRDSVVWNVVAAGEFSVEPETWCFPVAGCVAYRGYFRQARAEQFGQRLERRGYDVFVGGSPAYSTLGYFDDPVLSTMLARGPTEIAAMLFHELAHQKVYVRDDTELSESFATAVEQHGVENWLARQGAGEALDAYRGRLAREREFSALVARQRERLAAAFGRESEPAALRRAKAGIYADMRREYETLKAGWGGDRSYDGWFEGGFDNARLVAVTSYQRWVPGLKARLDALGPTAFYAEIESLLALEADAREARLIAWNDAATAAQ